MQSPKEADILALMIYRKGAKNGCAIYGFQ
jgi:hypothetical protein